MTKLKSAYFHAVAALTWLPIAASAQIYTCMDLNTANRVLRNHECLSGERTLTVQKPGEFSGSQSSAGSAVTFAARDEHVGNTKQQQSTNANATLPFNLDSIEALRLELRRARNDRAQRAAAIALGNLLVPMPANELRQSTMLEVESVLKAQMNSGKNSSARREAAEALSRLQSGLPVTQSTTSRSRPVTFQHFGSYSIGSDGTHCTHINNISHCR